MTVIDLPRIPRIPIDLTVDDLKHLPDYGYKYELHEGSLVLMSPAILWHSRASVRLVNALAKLGFEAAIEVGIRFGKRDCRDADVAVFKEPIDENEAYFPPSTIALVIEIVSRESEVRDTVTKPWKYAHAGIPEFWRVERIGKTGDATIYQHRLSDSEPVYVQTAVTTLSELEKSAE